MARSRHTAMTRKYNPEKFHSEMAELAHASPQDAADVAATWRERFHNAMEEGQKQTQRALGFSIAAGSSFLMSYFDGGWEAEREDTIAKWMASTEAASAAAELGKAVEDTSPFVEGDESDPTKIFGIPKVLVGTILLAAAAVFNLAKQYTPFVEAAALGGAAYWAGSMGFRIGKERKEEALEGEAASEAA